ncbi:BspA family leucine-rich repeat surface protein [Klebsiella oxytoca]|uniref:phage tail tube protein n=1 Tax=Klebsiella oxytoca TaxID=571 RepID=UPI003A920E1D
MNNKPYYYGQGRLYLSKIKPDGTPVNLLWLGDCSDLTLNIASEIKVKKTSLGGRRLDAGLSVTDTTASLAFTLYEHSQENLARALWGSSTSSISGYITGQAIPDGIKPGERFIICDASIWGVTIPGLESGIDFKVDPFFGAIEFITQPPAGVTVSYYHSRCAQVTLLSTIPDDLYLRYEGINNASPEMLVTLDVYRVKLSPVDVFNLINNDSSISSIPINARIMPDLSRYTGQDFDLYGRMGTSRRFDGILTLNIHEEQVSGTVSMDGAISLNYSTSLANHTVLITATSKTNRIYTTTAQTDSAGRYVASINLPYGFYSMVAECVLVTPFNNSLTLISESYDVEVPGPVVEFIMRMDNVNRPLFFANTSEEFTIDYGDGVDSYDYRFSTPQDNFSNVYATRELEVGKEYHITVKKSDSMRFAATATSSANAFNSLLEIIKVKSDRLSMSAFAANRTTLHTIHPGAFQIPLVTSFARAFNGCISLENIPDGLFNKCRYITQINNIFYGCTRLSAIPDGLFSGCSELINAQFAFYNCTALTTVGNNLFKDCTSLELLMSCFEKCLSLSHLGTGVLSGCVKVTNLTNAFFQCSSLESIPSDLFKDAINAVTFTSCFQRCALLQAIPGELFKNCQSAQTFFSAFSQCTSLNSVPDKLFANLTRVTTFESVFSWCSSLINVGKAVFSGCVQSAVFSHIFYECRLLESVGNDIFSGCVNATTFTAVFNQCRSLKAIPEFKDCPKVTSFNNAFYYCSSVEEVRENAFLNMSLVTTFASAFMLCSSLKRIGTGAFKGCMSLTNVSSMFERNSVLEDISSDIFEGCEKVTNVTSLFYQCLSLKYIPENLFSYFISVSSMKDVFNGCASLVSLPARLLSNCVSLTVLTNTFYGCTSLSAIPEKLFFYNVEITSLPSTFQGCSSLSEIPSDLFINLSKLVSLSSTFNGCSSISFLPAALLSYSPLLTTLNRAFMGTAIQSVPDEFLFNNTLLTSASGIFRECKSLLSVSNTLFSKCDKAYLLSHLFYGCSSLKTVGAGFFDSTAATSVAYSFFECSSLTVDLLTLFPLTSYPKITNTISTFAKSTITGSGLLFIGKVTNISNHYYTFQDCINLNDFERIPSDWTGNKL